MADSRPTIVVIDDSESVIELFKHGLESMDVDIVAFRSAEEAASYFTSNQPDLVFLDIIMSGKDGLTFLKELRRNEMHNDTKVIMISSKDYQQDRAIARELGALDFVPKPVRSRDLQELVVRHTNASSVT